MRIEYLLHFNFYETVSPTALITFRKKIFKKLNKKHFDFCRDTPRQILKREYSQRKKLDFDLLKKSKSNVDQLVI